MKGHRNEAVAEYSRDGGRLLSRSLEGAKVWDAKTGKLICEIPYQDYDSRNSATVQILYFKPLTDDAAIYVQGSDWGPAKMWSSQDCRDLTAQRGISAPKDLKAFAISDDGRAIFSGVRRAYGLTGHPALHDVASGQTIQSQATASFGLGAVFLPDGKRVAFIGGAVAPGQEADADISVKLRSKVSVVDFARPGAPMVTMTGHTDEVVILAVSPDGEEIASAGVDKSIRFWDATTGAPKSEPINALNVVRSLAYDPSGRRIAAGNIDGRVFIIDAKVHRTIVEVDVTRHGNVYVGFSPDGNTLVTGDGAGEVRQWAVEKFR